MATMQPLTLVRVTVGCFLVVHGIARVALDIVDDFGLFLDGVGLPLGLVVAWVLTAVELVGGFALALGLWVRYLAPWFVVELAVGIALVHAREGWFVVGAGRNGMEYSVLLIVCLVAVWVQDLTGKNKKKTRKR